MSTVEKITVNPACLRWARNRAQLNTLDLANKISVKEETVKAWEESGELSFSQLKRLSHATHVAIGYLFLPEPPVERLPVADFRTVGSVLVNEASPDLIDTLNTVLLRQDWYRAYAREEGAEKLGFVGSLRVTDNIVAAANTIRETVSWDSSARQIPKNWEDALDKQIELVERSGVLVMGNGIVNSNTNRTLDVADFRGFALADDYAPIIFLNHQDSTAARMFTLAHELVHIWVGASGVSNLQKTQTTEGGVEKFCNEVAAELLVPTSELNQKMQTVELRPGYLSELTKHFRVSSLVILRRLLDTNVLSRAEFDIQYENEMARIRNQAAKQANGGNFHYMLRSRLGKRFSHAIVSSTLHGATPFTDSFRLMGVNSADTVRKFAPVAMEVAF